MRLPIRRGSNEHRPYSQCSPLSQQTDKAHLKGRIQTALLPSGSSSWHSSHSQRVLPAGIATCSCAVAHSEGFYRRYTFSQRPHSNGTNLFYGAFAFRLGTSNLCQKHETLCEGNKGSASCKHPALHIIFHSRPTFATTNASKSWNLLLPASLQACVHLWCTQGN